MALLAPGSIDAIGTEHDGKTVVLTILDAEDWADVRGHLLALQAKINGYLGFIESGEVFESYPEAVGRSLRIDLICRHSIPDAAGGFLSKVSDVASELGVGFTHRTHASS